MIQFTLTKKYNANEHLFILTDKIENLKTAGLSKDEISYIKKETDDDNLFITLNQFKRFVFVQLVKEKKFLVETKELMRNAGNKLYKAIKVKKISEIVLVDYTKKNNFIIDCAEGLALSSYQFSKYLNDKKKKDAAIFNSVKILSNNIQASNIQELKTISEAVFITRDLINEPVSVINAESLAKAAKKLGKECGFEIEIFNKKKIESLRMGGLLAVNRGSIDPPTFTILEWKPKNAKNKKPIVLIGKGITFDTGGLSLKPTSDSMDYMKCDMSGAAAVIGAFYAISKEKIPVHVIGLIPATDNRPDGNAYTPSDIITMYDGSTVEVLNTDAEGRLILADALSFAKKYKPELVIDIATLTGSAMAAIGTFGIVTMGNASEKQMNKIKESGNNVHERIVEFPFFDDYNELVKSDIADLKNVGGKYAGAITAGKFLEHFTDYKWIHLDIAGCAFANHSDSYRGKGGTAVGVRLFFDFLKNY